MHCTRPEGGQLKRGRLTAAAASPPTPSHSPPLSGARPSTSCRYPPVPWHPPIHFYSSVRLGDPEQLAKIMDTDPYFVTQVGTQRGGAACGASAS